MRQGAGLSTLLHATAVCSLSLATSMDSLNWPAGALIKTQSRVFRTGSQYSLKRPASGFTVVIACRKLFASRLKSPATAQITFIPRAGAEGLEGSVNSLTELTNWLTEGLSGIPRCKYGLRRLAPYFLLFFESADYTQAMLTAYQSTGMQGALRAKVC